jgi:hypothetical protein
VNSSKVVARKIKKIKIRRLRKVKRRKVVPTDQAPSTKAIIPEAGINQKKTVLPVRNNAVFLTGLSKKSALLVEVRALVVIMTFKFVIREGWILVMKLILIR